MAVSSWRDANIAEFLSVLYTILKALRLAERISFCADQIILAIVLHTQGNLSGSLLYAACWRINSLGLYVLTLEVMSLDLITLPNAAFSSQSC